MARTKIEWTDETVNVVTGCTKVRPLGGCKNCYVERDFPRVYPGRKFTDVRLHPERLAQITSKNRSRMVFFNSMGDTFHEKVPNDFLRQMFATIMASPQHIFQILTKRIDRAVEFVGKLDHVPENLWLGISAEDQKTTEEAIKGLMGLGGQVSVRFLSLAPLLGPVSLLKAMFGVEKHSELTGCNCLQFVDGLGYGLDWVIVEGESGPNARPLHIDWVRRLRDECEEDGLPFIFKQWGEWGSEEIEGKGDYAQVHPEGFGHVVCKSRLEIFEGFVVKRVGKKAAGKLLDGKEHLEFPKALEEYRDRQMHLFEE